MKDEYMRYSMFVGRFQPFHDGHRWLIEQRLKLGKKVCIAVMDIHGIEPEKNPFKTEEVLLNIHNKFKKEISEGMVKVISIPPIESVNYGRDVGYEVIEHIPPDEIKEISATKIRREYEL
jgi:cytidyltransferase-like protein